jgi:hypothetical protein
MHVPTAATELSPLGRREYTSSHSVLGVCVVSYNELHCRANATKLGGKLPTISKKVSARWRMLVPTVAIIIVPHRYTSSHSSSALSCHKLLSITPSFQRDETW